MRQIAVEIDKTNARLIALQERLIDGDIDGAEYKAMKKRYQSVLNNSTSEYTLLSMEKSAFKKYVKYGFTLLSNLSGYYQQSNLVIKRKMVGSIFPENLVFDRKEYRTPKLNMLFMLKDFKIKRLGESKNKKVDNVHFSKDVVPLGATILNKDRRNWSKTNY